MGLESASTCDSKMFTFLSSSWGALFTNLLSDWASNYPGSWRKGWGGGSARIKTYPHMPGSNSTDAFDDQGSGHDFYGTLYTPPIGGRNNTDGGRAVLFPDYKQA